MLIDSAMGTELQRRGVAVDGVDWCATALATNADAVRAIHADYMTAGTEINIANTFAAGCHVLEPAGLGDQAVALNRRAVELVQEARDQAAMGSVWVAGSISGFIAGNDPANRPSLATLSASFREQAETFAEAGADLIIVEMIRAADTGIAMVEAAVATGLPVWAGFSFRRDADGAPVMLTKTHVIDPLDVVPAVMAAGASLAAVMHSDIDDWIWWRACGTGLWPSIPTAAISLCPSGSSRTSSTRPASSPRPRIGLPAASASSTSVLWRTPRQAGHKGRKPWTSASRHRSRRP